MKCFVIDLLELPLDTCMHIKNKYLSSLMSNLFLFYSTITNEKEVNGIFFRDFWGGWPNLCDHHYINPVLRANSYSRFDDSATNRGQIQVSFDTEQVRRQNKLFIFFDGFDCP